MPTRPPWVIKVTKTTLEQLAEKAQVSISTVSRVLNGKKGSTKGPRRRVLSILKGADYGTSNAVAATRTNRVIGVLVPAAAQHWGLHSNFIRAGLASGHGYRPPGRITSLWWVRSARI